ncbi:MAG: hypothetical protein HPY82_25260 [Gammaproteobacteria bacterium]|jgi:hypothetical protein|nr:hypothetical protein [Gammaproteobacteria bacterium]
MFEHKELDGEKHRVLPASEPFILEEVLELRVPRNDKPVTTVGRHQHGVAGGVLVERYLPPETVGDSWQHDPGTPWWEVVGHPPHGGIVADFNRAKGGAYRRALVPDRNVVAYAAAGEEVLLQGAEYKVVRKTDGQELKEATLVKLRQVYYS